MVLKEKQLTRLQLVAASPVRQLSARLICQFRDCNRHAVEQNFAVLSADNITFKGDDLLQKRSMKGHVATLLQQKFEP